MSRHRVSRVVAAGLIVAVAAGCDRSDELVSAPAESVSTSAPGSDSTTTPTDTTVPDTSPSTTTASSTTTTAPTTTSSTTTAPATTTTTTLPPTPTEEYALIYAGSSEGFTWQRIGAWDGSDWVNLDDDAAAPPAGIGSVSVAGVDLPAVAADVPYTTADYACIDAPLHTGLLPEVSIPESPLGYGYQAVAVTSDWPLQPRPVAAVGVDAPVYQEVGEALLAGRPDIDPANGDVVQVLRVDLDGDGTEEVLVSFRYLSAPDFGAVGDFSIVYARFVQSDGSVDDRIVWEWLVPDSPSFPAPGRASVAAVADLNGDGTMEVAIRSAFWEFGGIEIYEVTGSDFTPIMSGGCGV